MLPAPRQTCSSVPGGDDPPAAPALLRPRTLEGGRGGAESGDHSGMGRKEGDSAGSRRHWKLIPQVWLIPPGPGGCSFPVGLAHPADPGSSRLVPPGPGAGRCLPLAAAGSGCCPGTPDARGSQIHGEPAPAPETHTPPSCPAARAAEPRVAPGSAPRLPLLGYWFGVPGLHKPQTRTSITPQQEEKVQREQDPAPGCWPPSPRGAAPGLPFQGSQLVHSPNPE